VLPKFCGADPYYELATVIDGCQLNSVQLTSLWDLKHLPSCLNDMLNILLFGMEFHMSYETCSMQFAKWMSTVTCAVSLLNSSAYSFVCMQKIEYQWMDIHTFYIAEFCKKLPRNSSLYFDLQFYQCFSMMTCLHVWSQTFSSVFCPCTEHWHSCFVQVTSCFGPLCMLEEQNCTLYCLNSACQNINLLTQAVCIITISWHQHYNQVWSEAHLSQDMKMGQCVLLFWEVG
jgi:hypothetical protein